MAGSPAFQFYPDDFLGSVHVAVMSAEEVGMYLLLLCYDWNAKGIEYDPADLARFCRVSEEVFVKAWNRRLSRCFVERDGKWWNPRLERERDKQEKFRAKQVAAGLASAAARSSHRSTMVEPRFNSPIPSPAPATTGGRTRPFTRNGNGTGSTYAPGHIQLPEPAPCLADCGLVEVEGQRRPVQHHAEGCPNG